MLGDKEKLEENGEDSTNVCKELEQITENDSKYLQELLRISETPKHRMPLKIELFKKKKLRKSLTPRKLIFIKEDEKNVTDTLNDEKQSLDVECNKLEVTFDSVDDVNTLTKLQTQYLENIDFDSFPKLEKVEEPICTDNLDHEKQSSDVECNNLKVTFSSNDDVHILTDLQTQYLADIDFDSIPKLE